MWSCSEKPLPAERLLFSGASTDNKVFPVPVCTAKSSLGKKNKNGCLQSKVGVVKERRESLGRDGLSLFWPSGEAAESGRKKRSNCPRCSLTGSWSGRTDGHRVAVCVCGQSRFLILVSSYHLLRQLMPLSVAHSITVTFSVSSALSKPGSNCCRIRHKNTGPESFNILWLLF